MARRTLLFVGCYNTVDGTRNDGGIEVYDFGPASGTARHLYTASDLDNPSFLAIDAERHRLYAASEAADGALAAYAIDPDAGALVAIGRQSTRGTFTCHVAFDRTRRFAFACNFGAGPADAAGTQAVAVLPIAADGSLMPVAGSVAHRGSGPIQPHQNGPHAHCALASRDNRFVLVTDFGTDEIWTYSFDQRTGALGGAVRHLTLPPGTGPRTLIFAADRATGFATTEFTSAVLALSYDERSGQLTVRDTVATLAAGVTGANYPADIHGTADGRLYVSNRGNDSISVFTSRAAVRLAGTYPTGGRWPRSFALSEDGAWLIVAHQHSHDVMALAVDPKTGALGAGTIIARPHAPAFVALATFETRGDLPGVA